MHVLRHQDINREKSGGNHQGTCETTGQASSDGAGNQLTSDADPLLSRC